MKFEAKKAVRTKRPLKVSMEGLSGSGKTFTALRLAFDMIANGIGKKLVVFDSENESAGLYADVECDGRRWEFMHVTIGPEQQNPGTYAEAYRWAVGEGYDLVIFDSLSHAWHGALDQIDEYARHNKNDKFGGWKNVTPQQRDMIATLTDPRAHCIVTMRLKGEYDRVEKANGKSSIEKIGTKADQRENTEYEFDLVLRFTPKTNDCTVEKVRGCTAMNGKQANKPGPAFWKPLLDWWQGGAEVADPAADHRKALLAAATLDALKAAWAVVPQGLQPQVLADKDARKAELTAAGAR